MVSALSGCAAVTEAMPAAIIEPEPTPAPMASARQSKMPVAEVTEATRLTMIAPKIEPKTYIDSTPRYCGESAPKREVTMANDGSRSIENVAPTVAGPIRSSTASGSASRISRCGAA